jgi:hypothetical protein
MAESREHKQAHIDRIEDGNKAVLIIGDLEYEIVVPIENLPEGISGGDWLQVVIENGEIIEAEIDREAQAAVRQRISEKMSRLRSRGCGDQKRN